jgi:hypothetical protein
VVASTESVDQGGDGDCGFEIGETNVSITPRT